MDIRQGVAEPGKAGARREEGSGRLDWFWGDKRLFRGIGIGVPGGVSQVSKREASDVFAPSADAVVGLEAFAEPVVGGGTNATTGGGRGCRGCLGR